MEYVEDLEDSEDDMEDLAANWARAASSDDSDERGSDSESASDDDSASGDEGSVDAQRHKRGRDEGAAAKQAPRPSKQARAPRGRKGGVEYELEEERLPAPRELA